MSDVFLRNLPVPFFSQRQNDYVLVEKYDRDIKNEKKQIIHKKGDIKREISMDNRTCNITSVMMVMKYLGLTGIEKTINGKTFKTPNTPKEFLTNYFNHKYDFLFTKKDDKPTYEVACLEKWANLRKIGQYVFGAECLYTNEEDSSITLTELKNEIAKGFPVCISIGMTKYANGTYKKEGHVVVVRGFTKIDSVEYIILNDPWGSISDVDYNVYDVSDKTTLGSYFLENRQSDSRTDGDNVIIKLEDFRKKMIKGGYDKDNEATSYFHNFMKIHSCLWNFPDGSTDFSTDVIQAGIYSKIKYLNGGYPFNKNNVWHSGVHLGINDYIHSIGPGRLVAVRNSSIDRDSADKSFVLVEHQIEKNDSIKYFYSLYMHLKYITLKEEVKNYFEKKEDTSTLWLKQMLDKMLPCYKVLKNFNSENEEEGLITQSYKNIKLYPVTIDSNGFLIRSSTSTSNRYLGRRMLIKPLPVRNQKIYDKLLNPACYNDSDFLKDMRDKNIYRYNGYSYFWLDNELYATDYNNFEYGKIFEKQFLTTAKKIYELFEEKVVSFGEVKKYNNGSTTQIEDDLEALSLTWSDSIEKLLGTITYESGLLLFNLSPIEELIDLCLYASSISCERKELEKIENGFKKYLNKYKTLLKENLSKQYIKLQEINSNKKIDNQSDTDIQLKTAKEYVQEYCSFLINNINEDNVLIKLDAIYTDSNTTIKTGSIVKDYFVPTINKLKIDPIKRLSIYLNLYIWLLQIDCKVIKNNDYFKIDDKSSKELNKQINSIIDSIISGMIASYENVFVRYSEYDIEIGKNEIIGSSGKYETLTLAPNGKECSVIEPQIHFEIFSEEENIIQLNNVYEDLDDDILYNPNLIIDENKDLIKEEADKFSTEIKYFDDNMILISELDELYKKSNFKFLSDLALHLKSQWGEKDNKIKYKFYKKKYVVAEPEEYNRKKYKNKLIDYDDYYEKVIKPFMWFKADVFDNKHFRDGTAWYYHPLVFIEEIGKL